MSRRKSSRSTVEDQLFQKYVVNTCTGLGGLSGGCHGLGGIYDQQRLEARQDLLRAMDNDEGCDEVRYWWHLAEEYWNVEGYYKTWRQLTQAVEDYCESHGEGSSRRMGRGAGGRGRSVFTKKLEGLGAITSENSAEVEALEEKVTVPIKRGLHALMQPMTHSFQLAQCHTAIQFCLGRANDLDLSCSNLIGGPDSVRRVDGRQRAGDDAAGA